MTTATQPDSGIEQARRALSDPRRVQIWELLASQPATAKQLAAALGVAANRLYYHLRVLQAAGLIEIAGAEVSGRTAERLYAASPRNVSNELGQGSLEERILFYSSMLETTRTEITEVITAQAHRSPSGASPPALSLLRQIVCTTPDGFQELTRLVHELVAEIQEQHPGPPQARLLFALYDTTHPAE